MSFGGPCCLSISHLIHSVGLDFIGPCVHSRTWYWHHKCFHDQPDSQTLLNVLVIALLFGYIHLVQGRILVGAPAMCTTLVALQRCKTLQLQQRLCTTYCGIRTYHCLGPIADQTFSMSDALHYTYREGGGSLEQWEANYAWHWDYGAADSSGNKYLHWDPRGQWYVRLIPLACDLCMTHQQVAINSRQQPPMLEVPSGVLLRRDWWAYSIHGCAQLHYINAAIGWSKVPGYVTLSLTILGHTDILLLTPVSLSDIYVWLAAQAQEYGVMLDQPLL